jgi:hypothetical protein
MLSVMLNYPDNNFLPGMVMAMMTCHAAVFGVSPRIATIQPVH